MAVVSHSTRENTIFDNSRKVKKPCNCTSAKYVVHLLIGLDKVLNGNNTKMLQMAFCLNWEGLRGADFKKEALIESSNSHILKKHLYRSLPLASRVCKGVGKKPQISLHNLRQSKFYELLVSRYILDWYVVAAFHGQIIPSQIVPQYRQNFSGVFEPRAEARALLLCVPRSLGQESIPHALKPKKASFMSDFPLKLWNNLTIKWHDLTMERSGCKPLDG